MRSGDLRDVITLELKIETPNAAGQIVTTWGTPFTLFAKATRISEQNAQFILRYRSDIHTGTHRITFWDAIWTINDAVPDFKDARLTLNSDFSSLVEATHLQSTDREYIDGLTIVRPPES